MKLAPALFLTAALGVAPAFAEDAACKAVRLSDPGWTDITSTNAIASTLLTALGYEPEVKTLSVPIGYQAMKDGEIDVSSATGCRPSSISATTSTPPTPPTSS